MDGAERVVSRWDHLLLQGFFGGMSPGNLPCGRARTGKRRAKVPEVLFGEIALKIAI